MLVEERRKVYITLNDEERTILEKAAEITEGIRLNMNRDDGLELSEEVNVIDTLDYNEVKYIAECLFNIQEYTLEII